MEEALYSKQTKLKQKLINNKQNLEVTNSETMTQSEAVITVC